jgi:hypothetical protein
MSLVWMFIALGVSALTVVVVLQLLDGRAARVSGRLTASVVGVLMMLEGAAVLLTSRNAADTTAVIHGVAMMAAGAGIWSISYQHLWRTRNRS